MTTLIIVRQVEIEDDPQLESKPASAPINFGANNPDGGVDWRGGGDEGGRSGGEGCSCLYGNPCMDQYACSNWAGRFEVAKKNGWKG